MEGAQEYRGVSGFAAGVSAFCLSQPPTWQHSQAQLSRPPPPPVGWLVRKALQRCQGWGTWGSARLSAGVPGPPPSPSVLPGQSARPAGSHSALAAQLHLVTSATFLGPCCSAPCQARRVSVRWWLGVGQSRGITGSPQCPSYLLKLLQKAHFRLSTCRPSWLAAPGHRPPSASAAGRCSELVPCLCQQRGYSSR